MGLDTVELVIRLEETFGMAIPDEVAVELTTPRKVTDYIFSQVNAVNQSSCLSQQAFYHLRKKFVSVLGVARREFRPGTQLETLIPLELRREKWLKLMDEESSLSLPTLVRPIWIVSSLAYLSMLSFVIVTFYLRQPDAVSFVFGVFAAISVGYGGARATRPLQRNFRKGYERAGDLAKFLMVHNPRSFKQEWTRTQVAEIVRGILIDEIIRHNIPLKLTKNVGANGDYSLRLPYLTQ